MNKLTLKTIPIVLGLLAGSLPNLNGQSTQLADASANLHTFFGGVNPLPAPDDANLMYDLSAHFIDKNYFEVDLNNLDEYNHDLWYKMYEEVRYMHWTPTQLDAVDVTFINGNNKYPANTVPLGFLDYKYYDLKSDALTTGNYFDFNLTNNTVSDKPGRTSPPFILPPSRLFAVGPMIEKAIAADVRFAIDPDFIFKDNAASTYESKTIRINYGDGSGNHFYNGNITATIFENILYPSKGEKVIEVAILNNGQVEVACKTKLMVLAGKALPKPDVVFNQPGISVGKFEGCPGNGPKRSIIYVEGIDIFDRYSATNRGIGEIYEGMIQNERLANLQNFGYDYYIIDWNNSSLNLKTNSMNLARFIDWLKCQTSNDHQFVVIGESMGGLIARDALAYMESNDYQNNWPYGEPCKPEQMHQTRLMMTIDSPHQGANIPLGVQAAYRQFITGQMGDVMSVAGHIFSLVFNDFLDTDAAKQMLLYHIDTKDANNNFTPHQMYTNFQNQLQMPEFCKTMALANGNLTGAPQFNYVMNTTRTPLDRYIDLKADLFYRVLWFTVPNLEVNMDVRTNPNGSGTVYDYKYKNYEFQINVSLFSVNIGWFPKTNVSKTVAANNVRPFCTSAGGYWGNENFQDPLLKQRKYIDAWVYSQKIALTSEGCNEVDIMLGFGGALSVNAEASFCSDGMHFGFIPTASALDLGDIYYEDQPADFDFETEWGIDEILANTPFDVVQSIHSVNIFGNPRPARWLNRQHLNVRNVAVDSPINGTDELITCREFNDPDNDFHNYHLNKEIGDQAMYLNHFQVNRPASFQAEHALYVGVNPPYYQVSGQAFGGLQQRSMYTKTGSFGISTAPGVSANFIAFADTPGTGINYGNSFTGGPFTPNETTVLPVCCNDYSPRIAVIEEVEEATISEGVNSVSVYPNPVNQPNFFVQLNLDKETPINVRIFSIHGQLVHQQTAVATSGSNLLKIEFNNYVPGLYLVKTSTGEQEFTNKLIVR